MSDYEDDPSSRSSFSAAWLALPSPKTIFDKTTKFVLNAAHGKSRSLIPTTDETILRTADFGETGVIDWDDDLQIHREDEDEDAAFARQLLDDSQRISEQQLVVPEKEVLKGRWNRWEVVDPREDGNNDAVGLGMVRLKLAQRREQLPERKSARQRLLERQSQNKQSQQHQQPQQQGVVVAQRRRIAFTSLPPRILALVFEYLPVAQMLSLLNSCRVMRRVMHLREPGHVEGDGTDESASGSAVYTALGAQVWRVLVRRMGWRVWRERIRGRERRGRIWAPASHLRLLQRIGGVEGEADLAAIMSQEPDVLFKALFDDLHADYVAFRSLDRPMLPRWLLADDWSPSRVAERLDQLQWFGRAMLTSDAALINRRLTTAVDLFERTYARRFCAAFRAADCALMQQHARVLEHVREGRICVRVVVDAHPLFAQNATAPVAYSELRDAGKRVVGAHGFGVFLEQLQIAIQEHAQVSALALPSPRLPVSSLHVFVQALFSPGGIALQTLQGLYAHLRSIPVASADTLAVPGQVIVPDEAARDIMYLTTVADVVQLLLDAAGVWAELKPVALPVALGRRCVFAAFDDVIVDYVMLERRIIERAYDDGLSRWASRVKAESVGSESVPGGGAVHGESARLVNVRQRQQQLDEYRVRVLRVLESHLGIGPPDGSASASASASEVVADGEEKRQEKIARRRRSSGAQSINAGNAGGSLGMAVHLRRTVVGDVLWGSPISIDLCLNMLLANREAVDRLAVFARAPPDMRLRKLAQEAIELVFCILLQSIGNHVRPAFNKVVQELKDLEHSAMVVMGSSKSAAAAGGSATPASMGHHQQQQQHGLQSGGASSVYSARLIKAEKELRDKFTMSELRFFELIHLSDLVVQMVEIYYKKDLCMFISEQDFLNICNQEKKALEHTIDDSVAVGMDCVIEIILRQTEHILDTEQVAEDYHPDSNVSLTLTPTLACARAVQFLGESTMVLQNMALQKQMREVFMGEIGMRLFQVLLHNIKRFQITEPGGFQLIADLNLYYDWAAGNVDPETLRFFTALKDLANCFILAPRDLRGFLSDHYSRRTFDGVMRSEEVYDVVACRADYKQIRSQVEGHCDFM
ncbi:F-box protein: endocytic membrane traffic, recycling ReCYcling 1 [Coemansia sp. Benny D115]|nr:F-box protein: endocytic membrane traffic, recycling ReCYcling 1 [Coemansia sp. Benny D115]